MYRGGQPTLVPSDVDLKSYDINKDNYEVLIEKLHYNLNLNDKEKQEGQKRQFQQEGQIGSKPYEGCFNYITAIPENLITRPLITGLYDKTNIIKELISYSEEVKNLKKNYETLVKSFKENDKEIVFHVILGCIQSLLIVIKKIYVIIRKTGNNTFREYTKYFDFKIKRIEEHLAKLIEVDTLETKNVDGVGIVPLKIQNNMVLYERWKYNDEKGNTQETI